MATDDPDRHAVIVCQDALDRPAPALDNPPPRRPQAGGRGTTQCGPGLGEPIRVGCGSIDRRHDDRSEEHTSELQSLMRISYAVFCLKKQIIPSSVLYTSPRTRRICKARIPSTHSQIKCRVLIY